MKCPHCNSFELIYAKEPLAGNQMVVCRNPKCKFDGWQFPAEMIRTLIDGKKAQKALVVAREVLKCNNFTDIVKYIDIITEPKEE